MIMAFLSSAWGFLGKVPREVWYALAAAALLWWVDHRAYDRGWADRDAIAQEEARRAVEAGREADGFSRAASDNTRNEVEATNEQARSSADGSDDPLRAGLDSLRP